MEMIEIEAFIAVAASGSFTRAATALHLSQPAISRRIELLERELGAPLYERVATGARLTEAGQAFLPHAQQLLAAARDGAAAVRAATSAEQGSVTLALVGTLASTPLTAQLHAFRRAHPRLRLALHTARSDEVSALVRSGEAHLGLRYFRDPDPALDSRLVREEPLVVVAAGETAGADRPLDTVAALTGLPWVTFPVGGRSSGEPFARVLERQLLRCGLEDAELIVADSLTAQKRLIEADFGLGLLPASSVEEELQLGTLRALPLPELTVTIPVILIARRHGYLSPAAQSLIAALTAPDL
jgi:DNA-binding transcriptional LysR family regulator